MKKKNKNQPEYMNYVSSGEYPSGGYQNNAQQPYQGQQVQQPGQRPVANRLPEEKKQMSGFLDMLLSKQIVRQDSPFLPVVRELQLEAVDNAEYRLLQTDPNLDPALYNYLMGMVFWYRGYQNEAGQRFFQAMQSAPQNEVYSGTFNYQWGQNNDPQGTNNEKASGSCCSWTDCCDCLSCCSNLSSCLGS